MPTRSQILRTARRERAKKIIAHSLINPAVVKQFRDQKLASHVWMKKLPRATLEAAVEDFGLEFHTKPYKHQLVCSLLGATYPWFLFLLEMGLGKTKIILDCLRFHKQAGYLKGQVLVLVPSAVNAESWVKQIKAHAPDLSYTKLIGTHEERLELIESDADLLLMNYAGLMVYMTGWVEQKGRKKKSGMTPVASKVKKFTRRFGGIVTDESHKLGNQESLVWRLCRRVRDNCDVRYAATGTLFGRHPEKAFSQFKLIDEGETLGNTLAMFRHAYYTGEVNYFGGVNWTFDESNLPRVHTRLQNRSIRYEDKECFDLPKLIEDTVVVELSEEQRIYYNRAAQKLRGSRGDFREMENSFIRMRQICAGFVALKNEEEERLELEFSDNAKIEALEALLENVPVGSKVVIFHEFRPTGPIIERLLQKLKVKYASLRGGIRNPTAQYNAFLNDPSITALVANTSTGGTGIDDLQRVARFMVFYELPVDPISYRQAVKRLHRIGTTNRVYKYILEARGTVDEKLWSFIDQGTNLFSAIIDGRETIKEIQK